MTRTEFTKEYKNTIINIPVIPTSETVSYITFSLINKVTEIEEKKYGTLYNPYKFKISYKFVELLMYDYADSKVLFRFQGKEDTIELSILKSIELLLKFFEEDIHEDTNKTFTGVY